MESLRQLFKVGLGPSSSHTMGPRKAAEMFLERNKFAVRFEVTLYGSLAATGKGHMTDQAILDVLTPVAPTEIVWKPDVFLPYHPNGMEFKAFATNGSVFEDWTAYSVGGGDLEWEGSKNAHKHVYPLTTITDIMKWIDAGGRSFWEYVEEVEGQDIWDYLRYVWKAMREAVERGLVTEGVLPGGLGIRRKAVNYNQRAKGFVGGLQSRGLVYSYALATSEENAGGGVIVTAPTCGSCGVLPAVLYHLHKSRNFPEARMLHALATAGLFGNIVKANASVSGADVGCQGEVGVACAMAAAAACQLFGGTPNQVEYAAEMGLEHHLGLTCDPVEGLVQVPCIERNAYAAARALDANLYATFSDGNHSVSFDRVVEVMKQTGHDIPSLYKETSTGGLAATHVEKISPFDFEKMMNAQKGEE